MSKETQPKVEIKPEKIETISELSSKGIQPNPQASIKGPITAAKVVKLGFLNKSLYFFGGMGLTFVCLYSQFVNYLKKSDELLSYEIEDLKKLIQRRNMMEGSSNSTGDKIVVHEESQIVKDDGKVHTVIDLHETKVIDNKNNKI